MKKIFAILLAVAVVALSFDVGLAYHYCGGSLVEVKFVMGYGEAGCGMEGDNEKEPCNSHDAFTSSTCCQNKLHQIEADEFQFLKKTLDFSKSFPLFTSLVRKILLDPDTTFKKVIFIKPPPNLTAVSLPLIQVFLI